jgi:hypothetical protein
MVICEVVDITYRDFVANLPGIFDPAQRGWQAHLLIPTATKLVRIAGDRLGIIN